MREAHFNGQPNYQDADLTKAKLTREKGVNVGFYAEYTLGEAQGHAELTAQHKRPPHADLLLALGRLVPHLCFMCRQVPQIDDEGIGFAWDNPYIQSLVLDNDFHARRDFADFIVTGYSYDDKGGVVLIGQRLLPTGKVLNLIAPREDLAPEQETGMEYSYWPVLAKRLRECDEEVKAYLAGKSGPMVVQGDLFDDEDEEEDY
jgi:hypothetical protein